MRDSATEMYLVHNTGLVKAPRAHLSRSSVKPGVDKKVSRPGLAIAGSVFGCFPWSCKAACGREPHRRALTNPYSAMSGGALTSVAAGHSVPAADHIVPSVPIHKLMVVSSSRPVDFR